MARSKVAYRHPVLRAGLLNGVPPELVMFPPEWDLAQSDFFLNAKLMQSSQMTQIININIKGKIRASLIS